MNLIKTDLKEAAGLEPLFLLADPEKAAIAKYIESCDIFALKDNAEDLGAICIQPQGDTAEIKNIAVYPAKQSRGLGSLMLRLIFAYYKKHGFKTITVGTAREVEWIVNFYKRHGFKEAKIIKNFFKDNYAEPVYDSGILCTDMIVLEKEL